MTLYCDQFDRADTTGSLGGNWNSYSSFSTGPGGMWTIVSQQAVSGSTATNAALYTLPAGNDQFSQLVMVNNSGSSTGVMVRANYVSGDAFIRGYLARHTGSNIAIISFAADGSTSTSLANVAHTRAAGQVLRLRVSGTTLTASINGTDVLTATDSTWASGSVGVRVAGTSGVTIDGWYGGDLADASSAPTTGVGTAATTGAGGGGTGGGTGGNVTETINASPANGIPAYKGIVWGPSGRLMLPGKPLHRLHADFWGPSGAYTPPAWLTVPEGTATLTSPAAGPGLLELTTAATTGAKATLAVTPQLVTSQHRALRIDIEAMSFSVTTPAAEWRAGFTDGATLGAGAAQVSAAGMAFLHSGGENLRTKTNTSHLGATANHRRQTSILLVPPSKEVFLLEDDELIGWRDGTGTWVDGTVTAAVSITTTTGTAQTLRLSSLTVTTYA